MNLLITGASGMLGQDIVTAATASGHEVLGLSHADLDISDPLAVQSTVADARADMVLNCAAWTDVDGAEADSEKAFAVNSAGAGNVARAATDSARGSSTCPVITCSTVENVTLISSPIQPNLYPHTGDRSLAANSRSRTRRRDGTRSCGPPGSSGPAAAASRRRSCGWLRSGTS